MIVQILVGVIAALLVFIVGLGWLRWRHASRVYLYGLSGPNPGLQNRGGFVSPPTEPEGVPVAQTDDGRLFLIIAHNHCPHCDRDTHWIKGPQGGLMTNIQCEKCGWWYNVAEMIGIAQEIGDKGERRIH